MTGVASIVIVTRPPDAMTTPSWTATSPAARPGHCGSRTSRPSESGRTGRRRSSRLRAAKAFLGRLEHEIDGPAPARVRRQQRGRAEQRHGVTVMAAGMHHAGFPARHRAGRWSRRSAAHPYRHAGRLALRRSRAIASRRRRVRRSRPSKRMPSSVSRSCTKAAVAFSWRDSSGLACRCRRHAVSFWCSSGVKAWISPWVSASATLADYPAPHRAPWNASRAATSSWPGLTRPSTSCFAARLWMPGTSSVKTCFALLPGPDESTPPASPAPSSRS